MLPKKDPEKLVREAHDRTFPAGATLTKEGEAGVTFGVIVAGRAAVSVHGRPVRTLGPGDYFGEMALIDGEYRAASVHADGELRCAAMTAWNFRPFVKEHPDVAWALLTALVKRVRQGQARQTVTTG